MNSRENRVEVNLGRGVRLGQINRETQHFPGMGRGGETMMRGTDFSARALPLRA